MDYLIPSLCGGMHQWRLTLEKSAERKEIPAFPRRSVGTRLGVDIKSTNEGIFPEKPYWGGECYSASSYMYGRFETMMKPNSLPGLVTSFFLLEVGKDVDNSIVDWYEIN